MKALFLLCFCLTLFAQAAFSSIESHSFDSAEKEKIYLELVDELRCLVCQNQNLAASNSGLAKDLRRQAFQMVSAGQTKEQITQYMTERYGDFVLYEPPFKKVTLVLWIGPFVIFIIAAWALFSSIKNSQKLLNSKKSTEEDT
ncbi:MAG: cytochrome c-type biogenesis protein [Cycloclasticus sp.]|jgi:cytochrome c-type biogenesis protein CcmH